MTMRRTLIGAGAAFAIAAGLLASAPSSASAAAGPVVPASAFGMTINSYSGTNPLPTSVGSVRLWDSGVSWADLQPTAGAINWAPLDGAVNRARGAGIRDIEYVLGSTPSWARIRSSAERNDLPAAGRASHPAKDAYYLSFLKAVLARYKGRITSYEIWNEANLPTFYRGTPTQLARLGLSAFKVIKSIDPRARVVSPSWLLRYWTTPREKQLAAFKAVGWPFDVIAVHAYPFSLEGPDARVKYLLAFKKRLATLGAKKPIWDTELNFGDRRPGYPRRVYTGATAANLLARAYIDGLRYGISRTYWYSWDSHILGIDTTSTTGTPTAAGVAYGVIKKWIAGNHWNGCTTVGRVSRCALSTANGRRRTIIYTTGTSVRTVVPVGATSACTLDDKCRAIKPGTPFYATASPQFILGA